MIKPLDTMQYCAAKLNSERRAFIIRTKYDRMGLATKLNEVKETDFVVLEKVKGKITNWEWVAVKRGDIDFITFDIQEDAVIEYMRLTK